MSTNWVPPTPERAAEILKQAQRTAAVLNEAQRRLSTILVKLAADSTPEQFEADLDEMDLTAMEAADLLERSGDEAASVRALVARLRQRG
jgi:hypothetical protein